MREDTKELAQAIVDTLNQPACNAEGEPMDRHGWHGYFGLFTLMAKECWALAIALAAEGNPEAGRFLTLAEQAQDAATSMTSNRGDLPHAAFVAFRNHFTHFYLKALTVGEAH